jgi:hypothetical protein
MSKKLLLNWDTVVLRIIIYDWPYKKEKYPENTYNLKECVVRYASNAMNPFEYVRMADEMLKSKDVQPHMMMSIYKKIFAGAVRNAIELYRRAYQGNSLDMKLINFEDAQYDDFEYAEIKPSKPKKHVDTTTVRTVPKKRTKRSAS